jgi:tRNA threonylcarbamoyladenosine modification (KEOPS) complex  Pcc1 subunit
MYETEIRVRYRSTSLAKSITKALSPDDEATRGRVRVSSQAKGRTLYVSVTGADHIETLQATLQDIFRCIHAAETSLTRLEKVLG